MGWPPCMWKGCDNWPSVGHSGLCHECIKDPKKVEVIANEMFENSFSFSQKCFDSSSLLAFLTNKPGPIVMLRYVADLMERNPKLNLEQAIEEVRKEYWSHPVGLKNVITEKVD